MVSFGLELDDLLLGTLLAALVMYFHLTCNGCGRGVCRFKRIAGASTGEGGCESGGSSNSGNNHGNGGGGNGYAMANVVDNGGGRGSLDIFDGSRGSILKESPTTDGMSACNAASGAGAEAADMRGTGAVTDPFWGHEGRFIREGQEMRSLSPQRYDDEAWGGDTFQEPRRGGQDPTHADKIPFESRRDQPKLAQQNPELYFSSEGNRLRSKTDGDRNRGYSADIDTTPTEIEGLRRELARLKQLAGGAPDGYSHHPGRA